MRPLSETDITSGFEPDIGGSNPPEDTNKMNISRLASLSAVGREP